MSESRRALVRIGSNFARLIGAMVMGLLMIRFLLQAVGGEAVGLFLLLGSTMGLATMIEESVENSMVRELGRAHHAGDNHAFRIMFNSAMAVSTCAGACSLVMFAVIIAVAPLLEIDAHLLAAARWFLVAKSLESLAVIVCSPIYNMYMVTERMMSVNMWMLARRSSGMIAALMVLGLKPASPSAGLIMFAWLTTAVHLLVLVAAVAGMVWRDRRLVPSPRMIDRAACMEVVRTSGTNSSMYATQLLQIPACSILMNLTFGLHGSLVFGMAVQVSGYVRMLAGGLVAGLEAVATRLSSVAHPLGAKSRLQTLIDHATRLQAFVAVPGAAGMFVIAETFLRVWVANQGLSEAAIAQAVLLARILIFGFLAQSILDVWWRALYGAGMVRHFARPFAISAIATAPLAFVLVRALPTDAAIAGPALAYASLNLVLAGLIMPRVVARCFDVSARRLVLVLLLPLPPAVAAAFAARWVENMFATPTLWVLFLTMAAYAIVYGALAFVFVLERGDRERLALVFNRFRTPR